MPAPLAALQASAQDTAEAAAGLLLSAAALAADTLAAVLSPTELAAEVFERATHPDPDTVDEAGADRRHGPRV